jgi:hypothetical protein
LVARPVKAAPRLVPKVAPPAVGLALREVAALNLEGCAICQVADRIR